MKNLTFAVSTGGIKNTQLSTWEGNFPALAKMFSNSTIGSKDGSYFVRCIGTKRNDTDTADTADILIIDGDSRIDGNGKIVAGAPNPLDVHQVLKKLGLSHIIYPSYSNSMFTKELDEKGIDSGGLSGANYHKYRVTISGKYNRKQLKALVEYVIKELHKAGVMLADVKENYTWSQAWYFPRVPDNDRLSLFKFYWYRGRALDVDKIYSEWSAQQTKLVEPKQKTRNENKNAPMTEVEWAKVASALGCISNDGYQDWLSVGMAINFADSSVRGFEAWNRWSESSSKYDLEHQEKTWRSFNSTKNKTVTLGTLFFMAQQNGWRPPNRSNYSQGDERLVIDSSRYDSIISNTIAQLSLDINAWDTDEFKGVLLDLYRNDQESYQRIRRQLKPLKISTEVDKEIKRLNRLRKAKKTPPGKMLITSTSNGFTTNPRVNQGELLNLNHDTGESTRVVESEAAVILAGHLNGIVAFSSQAQVWFIFTGTHWQPQENDGEVDAMLSAMLFLGTGNTGFTEPYKKNIKAIIKGSGFLPLPNPLNNFIPFLNGLLDPATKELIPTTYLNAQTYCLPYFYDANAKCPNIEEWLYQALDKDEDTIEFLIVWLAALLHGRADLQKFLHLLGSGGTGKGVFIRLAIALVGEQNAASTTLKELENNRFEVARFFGKKLVSITDSDKYGGSINTLKAMTGQDHLRIERKHQQQSGGFNYSGLICMASNESLTSTDHSSGLERRRLTVIFDIRATNEDKQRWESQGGEETMLHSEIPGLVNILLNYSQDEISDIIRHPPRKSKEANFDAMTTSNPLAEWIIENCVPEATSWTQLGDKREIRELGCEVRFKNSNDRLYPNYLTWCQRHNRSPHSVKRFRENIMDTMKTLGVDVKETRLSVGQGISGIRLAKPGENNVKIWNKHLKMCGLV